MRGIDGRILPNIRSVSPWTTDSVPGELPLYGICTVLTPAMELNSSPARCAGLPGPVDAKFKRPGRDFAAVIRSFTDLAGTEGWITSRYVVDATAEIGA